MLRMSFFSRILLLLFIINPSYLFAEISAKTDQQIAKIVHAKLKKARNFPDKNIIVRVEDGKVYLRGVLDTQIDINRAAQIAHSVEDVVEVNFQDLKLSSANKPLGDAIISTKVRGRLINLRISNKISNNCVIDIETKNGFVYLTGVANSTKDKQTIIESVRKIRDVKDVVETIDV